MNNSNTIMNIGNYEIRQLCIILSDYLHVKLDALIVDFELTSFGAILITSFLISCLYKIFPTLVKKR